MDAGRIVCCPVLPTMTENRPTARSQPDNGKPDAAPHAGRTSVGQWGRALTLELQACCSVAFGVQHTPGNTPPTSVSQHVLEFSPFKCFRYFCTFFLKLPWISGCKFIFRPFFFYRLLLCVLITFTFTRAPFFCSSRISIR